jgi:hypothetical protein
MPTFPTETLPEWLRAFVEAEAVATQTPADLAAMLALTVCGAGAAGKVRVEVKEDYQEPVNLFALVVLPPGNRKSAVFADIVRPVEELEEQMADQREVAIADANNEREIMGHRLAKLQKAAADGTLEKRAKAAAEAKDLANRLATTEVPERPKLIVDDITPEKLANLLASQDGRMAVLSAEGGIFRIMAGCYSAAGETNFEVFLKGHSGDALRVDRIKRRSEYVARPALTLGLTVQPDVLDGLFEKTSFRGRGLLGRFVYAMPVSLLGSREADPPLVPETVRAEYSTRLLSIWSLPAKDGEEKPTAHVVRLTEAARDQWHGFFRWLEPQLAPEGELGDITDWAGKLCGGVARIAGILHLAEHAGHSDHWQHDVTVETLERAIRIGEYLIPHALAAFGKMGADPATERANSILRWITKGNLQSFTLRECYRALRGKFRKVDQVEPCIALLVDHGYLREQPTSQRKGAGRHPSPRYEVNPSILGQNGQN